MPQPPAQSNSSQLQQPGLFRGSPRGCRSTHASRAAASHPVFAGACRSQVSVWHQPARALGGDELPRGSRAQWGDWLRGWGFGTLGSPSPGQPI